ncbi:MAG: hypothetical protein M3303_07675 [Gemmatimonadota bacterium]|nr:hypothetical protein [Gemmatimonadota bacterium]
MSYPSASPDQSVRDGSSEPLVEKLLAPFRRFAATAFGEAALLDAAKVGVLSASALAGAMGWLLLRRTPDTSSAAANHASSGDTTISEPD